MRRSFLAIFLCSVLFASVSYAADKFIIPKKAQEPEPAVEERVIKVEGTLERPRVIFILPRGKLWREDPSKKSFVDEMLEQVYPEPVIEEIYRNRTVRR